MDEYLPDSRQWLYDDVNQWLDTVLAGDTDGGLQERMYLLLAEAGMVSAPRCFQPIMLLLPPTDTPSVPPPLIPFPPCMLDTLLKPRTLPPAHHFLNPTLNLHPSGQEHVWCSDGGAAVGGEPVQQEASAGECWERGLSLTGKSQ